MCEYLDWLNLYVDPVVNRMINGEYQLEFSIEAEHSLHQILFNRLEFIAGDTLEMTFRDRLARICDMYKSMPKLAPKDDYDKTIKEFYDELMAGGIGAFDLEVPKLRSKLEACSLRFENAFCEMFERIAANRFVIEKDLLGGKEIGEIDSFVCENADVHNGGRCTTIIKCASGILVYKPRELRTDLLFSKLCEEILESDSYIPKTIVPDSQYGFCEYVINDPASTHEEAANFYYNFGSLAALIKLLGGVDFHYENFLSKREYPIVIDLETILHPNLNMLLQGRDNSFYDEFERTISQSALFSSIIYGTEISPLFNTTVDNKCAPVVGAIKLTVKDFEEDFLRGFEKTYRKCLEKREAVEQFIKECSKIKLRVIIRQTPIYVTCIKELNKRKNLCNAESARCLEKVLVGKYPNELIESEKETLINDEIPLFHLGIEERTLFLSNGKTIKSRLGNNIISDINKGMNLMNEAELSYEKEVIKRAFQNSSIVADPAESEYYHNVPDRLSRLEKIYEDIKSAIITTPSGKVCIIENHAGSSATMLTPYLGDGLMGVAVFLAAFCKTTNNPQLKEESGALCHIFLNQLIENVKNMQLTDDTDYLKKVVGEADGVAGLLKGYLLINRYLENAIDEKDFTAIVELALKVAYLPTENTDNISGIAGLISVFCQFEEVSSLQEVREAVNYMANRLLTMRNLEYEGLKVYRYYGNSRPMSGAGHGMAGIGLALYLAYVMHGNDAFFDAALDSFKFEDIVFSPKIGSWPDNRFTLYSNNAMHGFCSGAPGIGIVLSRIRCIENDNSYKRKRKLTECDLFERNEERALLVCRTHPKLERDHLCCGNAASADYFIEKYIETCDECYLEAARDILLSKKKYRFISKEYAPVNKYSLYFGESGVGYELIRITDPFSFRSILL